MRQRFFSSHSTHVAAVLGLALGVAFACGNEPNEARTGLGGEGGSAESDGLGGAGGSMFEAEDCSSRPTFECVFSCFSDWFFEPICVDDRWGCEPGTLDRRTCDPDDLRCAGIRAPGETCGPDGWACRPSPADIAECPSTLCYTCVDFEGPMEDGGCRCICTGSGDQGSVHCTNK